jgi:type I restriction enzyme S subunit
MSKYESYKPIEELWLTQIPDSWEDIKIKFLFSERSEKGYPDEPLLVASQNMGVVPKGVYGNRTVEATKDLHLLKLVRVGDFVISLRSFQGGIEYAYYQGIISPAYTIMVPNQKIVPGYFRYLAKSRLFIELLQLCVTGIREGQNIDYGKLKNHLIPVPPREEQDQIARYLDWQTSKINRLIAAKKQQIQVLREQQQKLICEVITKGLHSDVDYKDSHVAWIGDIPSHWSAIRCKYLFRERDERSKEGAETHLSMSQKYGLVPDSQLDERRMLSESYAGGKLCYQDDLVLNRLKAHLGVFALAPQFGVISPDYTVLIPNTERIIPSFGEMVLKSALCRRELRVRVRGIIEGFWRLYTDDFYTIYLPVPPIEEQKEIMQYVDAQAKMTAALENALNREIELLHELRTRLISDTVTGQIDVRSIEVPDFKLVEEAADEAEEPEYEMEVE